MNRNEHITIPRFHFEALKREAEIAGYARRLALELECLLTSTRDSAAQSRWWDSAMEALVQYHDAIERLYTTDGEPTMHELANQLETRSSP